MNVNAQIPDEDYQPNSPYSRYNRSSQGDTTDEKLQHRNPLEDSITISYRYFDSSRNHLLDSSISDFFLRYPVPMRYIDLGNFGNASKSLLFSPFMQPGFDAGFHAYDVYRYKLEDTRFFTTTRPYTELAYLLGSKAEQMINVLHTQNRKSSVNFTFEYRFINAPGFLKNQNTSHNNIRINLSYLSKNKRYGNNFIFISNKLRSSENGGLQDGVKLTGLSFNDPFSAPVILGNGSTSDRNFFVTSLPTGTSYDEKILLFRQNYDFGQKDSVVTDSVTYKLFYPRFRLQHTIEYKKENFQYKDIYPDSSLYAQYYSYPLLNADTVLFRDQWKTLTNDVSIYSYPQKNNQAQFLRAGAGYEYISGGAYPYIKVYKNVFIKGEYRNRTRNQKWDIVASGQFYSAGDYAGDYSAFVSLERNLNNKTGSLMVGFQNVNRSPSSIFSKEITSFPVNHDEGFGKENISKAFADVMLNRLQLRLMGEYYFITNYIYFDDNFSAKQESSLFNVLHVGAEKTIKLRRHWNWYAQVHVQQTAGNPPVNVPFIYTQHRIAFEGNFFTNLFLSTGFEIRYYTNYKADRYSPLTGQFFYQEAYTTSNRPDVNLFFNFRIKSFKGFVRLENLNTLNPNDKYQFNEYSYAVPRYPQKALWLRVGIWWNFVN